MLGLPAVHGLHLDTAHTIAVGPIAAREPRIRQSSVVNRHSSIPYVLL
jgi:hypothetical protein